MSSPFDAWPGTVEIDGHAVANFRNMRGLKPDGLAERSGVGRSTIEKWEAAGVTPAQADKVRAVAAALAVGVRDLLTAEFRQRVERQAAAPARGASAAGPPGAARRQPAPPYDRPSQLPPALADFVGREVEARAVADRLRGAGGRVGLSSALRGMGGVGKTTLAVQVAHAVKGDFPDGQLYLDLRGFAFAGGPGGPPSGPADPAEAMAHVVRAFHPEAVNLPGSAADLLPRYRAVLAGKRALVVLDNAAGEAQVRDLLAGDKAAFLVTSRHALALDGVASVPVDGLSATESLELLRGIAGARATDAELGEVAGLCGHLPLALRVAGDFLRVNAAWAAGEYVAALRRDGLARLRVGDDPARNVEAVLKLSSAQLARDDVLLAVRWSLLAARPADFDAPAAAAFWGLPWPDPAALDALSALVNRSLLLFDAAARRYRLHDLLRPVAAGLFAGGPGRA